MFEDINYRSGLEAMRMYGYGNMPITDNELASPYGFLHELLTTNLWNTTFSRVSNKSRSFIKFGLSSLGDYLWSYKDIKYCEKNFIPIICVQMNLKYLSRIDCKEKVYANCYEAFDDLLDMYYVMYMINSLSVKNSRYRDFFRLRIEVISSIEAGTNFEESVTLVMDTLKRYRLERLESHRSASV